MQTTSAEQEVFVGGAISTHSAVPAIDGVRQTGGAFETRNANKPPA